MRKNVFVSFAVCMALQATAAAAGGNAVVGEGVFGRCASCHSIGEYQAWRKGQVLKGLFNRPVASQVGFKYSESMAALGASGAKWDAATLDQFLKYPSEFVKGTKMTAPPVRRETERADLIAYLITL